MGDTAGLVPEISKTLLELDVLTLILLGFLLTLGIIGLRSVVEQLGGQKKDKEDDGVSEFNVLVSCQADALAFTGVGG